MIEIALIIVSVLLITLVLLQQRNVGMSGLFGGGEAGGFYQARRGMDKFFFVSTIVLSVVFIGLSVYKLFLN